MVTTIPPTNTGPVATGSFSAVKNTDSQPNRVAARRDTVEFGSNGELTQEQLQHIILDRAFEQLRGVVDEARLELGIPEGAVIDTSPEATANRIADFALGFFSQYAENNGLADDEAGREQFVQFIGGAVSQGIQDARDILTALNALNPEVDTGIEETVGFIQQRFDDFVLNGLT